MHHAIRDALAEAQGASEFVIAGNIDIRGFSRFSLEVESAETAFFIKKFYLKALSEYIPPEAFFKLTGDGMLFVLPYDERDFQAKVANVLHQCVRLVEDFPRLLDDEPMINFEVPRQLGVGLSRGAACKLYTGSKVLDYSGKVLNQASRLMDIARPEGVVFDDSYGYGLLPEETQRRFERKDVFLRGIAEDKPLSVYYVPGMTTISERHLRPLREPKWHTLNSGPLTLAKITTDSFSFDLPTAPLSTSDVTVLLTHELDKQGRVSVDLYSEDVLEGAVVRRVGNQWEVKIPVDRIRAALGKPWKATWPFKIIAKYPEA